MLQMLIDYFQDLIREIPTLIGDVRNAFREVSGGPSKKTRSRTIKTWGCTMSWNFYINIDLFWAPDEFFQMSFGLRRVLYMAVLSRELMFISIPVFGISGVPPRRVLAGVAITLVIFPVLPPASGDSFV